MSEPRIFTQLEVRAVLPKARELSAKRLGKPHVYSELDLINALWGYMSGYVTDEDKKQMISSDNIKWALEYLDTFGHTPPLYLTYPKGNGKGLYMIKRNE